MFHFLKENCCLHSFEIFIPTCNFMPLNLCSHTPKTSYSRHHIQMDDCFPGICSCTQNMTNTFQTFYLLTIVHSTVEPHYKEVGYNKTLL